MKRPPDPLEWHPAYAEHTWLLDWLHRTGQYATSHEIRMPHYSGPRLAATYVTEDVPLFAPSYSVRTLTRHEAAGPAPYVGRPFVYVWPFAVDEVGRAVAGESQRRYKREDDFIRRWDDPYAVPEAGWLT